jgi:hypothetical protein
MKWIEIVFFLTFFGDSLDGYLCDHTVSIINQDTVCVNYVLEMQPWPLFQGSSKTINATFIDSWCGIDSCRIDDLFFYNEVF